MFFVFHSNFVPLGTGLIIFRLRALQGVSAGLAVRVFSRSQLLTAAHGVAFESYERAIDSHIRNLRHKLEPDDLIVTVHGVGYKFHA
jgi:hypothetical protein